MSYAYPLDSVVTYDALGTPQYDRAVTSETLRAILHVMLTDGVFLEEDIDMQVTATGSMSVQVGKGYCVIRGAQKIFSTPEIVQIPASNTLNRIDTIVARLDLNQDVRDVVLDVVKGTPSSTPVTPELTRTSSIWEIGLANVKVTANSSVIAQENITDTRLDTNRCGIVSSLMAFDTTSLYDQIQADLLTFKDISEADFENWSAAQKNEWLNWIALNEADFLAWYQRMKDQLSQDAAGNLQLQIDALNSDLSKRIDGLEAEMPFAGGSKININFEYDVVPNMQYSNEHYKLTVGDTVRENNFSSSQLHFDEYGILTVGDGVLEVTYDITDLTTGKITPASYTYTIKMPYFGRFAYNVTISTSSSHCYIGWLESIGKNVSLYPTIEDVFADEKLLRELMTRHASVDYLVEWLANNYEDAHTVLNNDYCAKWINLRDYALDKLYANPTVKAVMDEVDKYGYGEWALVGQVPKMTSNTAPYGEAFADSEWNSQIKAYMVFDGDDTTQWAPNQNSAAFGSAYVGYKFNNPSCIKSVLIGSRTSSAGNLRIKGFRIEASNDCISWDAIFDSAFEDSIASGSQVRYKQKFSFNNDKRYLAYRLVILSGESAANIEVNTLQFYAWQPKGNVPVMTSDTSPYGEASASSTWGSGNEAYRLFDNTDIPWASASKVQACTVGYKFVNPICVRRFMFEAQFASPKTFDLQGSTDGSTWDTLQSYSIDSAPTSHDVFEFDCDNELYYMQYRLNIKTAYGSDNVGLFELQFYGRQLNVSVPTMTSNTTPWGEVSGDSIYSSNYDYYKAFNNDAYGWIPASSAVLGTTYLQYNFQKQTAITCLMLKHIKASILIDNIVFHLQVSDNGVDFTTVKDDILLESSDTEYYFNVDGIIGKYFRLVYISNSKNTPNAGIGFKCQMYCLDYSEREFAEGSTMKYLYDHGVELEPLESYGSGTHTKQDGYLEINYNASDSVGGFRTSNKIDFTNYILQRQCVGDIISGTNYAIETWKDLPSHSTYSTQRLSSKSATNDMLPNNVYDDITNINENVYSCIGMTSNGLISVHSTVREWWLE